MYEASDARGRSFAFKVIHKATIESSKRNKSKLLAELKIHKSMRHHHIVRFLDQFEDKDNVYFKLELCRHGSMNDIVKKRGKYSEPESRYFMTQILTGCQHMHLNSVIHRDLKLGNIFLDDDMQVKIGDFGLAALLNFPEERKKTVCGTPNYIAPEILYDQGDGHSFEVDIWSVGVILYTLLIGKPPFQTNNVQKIYERIKRNEYEIPLESTISDQARDLIQSILTPDPSERPSLIEIMDHPWFEAGSIPLTVPGAACKMEPVLPILTRTESLANFRKLKEIGEWNPHADDLLEEDDEEDDEQDDDEDEVMVNGEADHYHHHQQQAQQQQQRSVSRRQELKMRLKEMERLEDERLATNREAERAIQPGSPISTLLQYAQQPLVKLPAAAKLPMSGSSATHRSGGAAPRNGSGTSGLAKQLGALSVSRATPASSTRHAAAADAANMLPPQRSAQSYASGTTEDPTEDRRALTAKARLMAGINHPAGSAVSVASIESASTRRSGFRPTANSARGGFTEVIVERLNAALGAYEANALLTLPDDALTGEPTVLPVLEVQVRDDGTTRRSPPIPSAFIVSWLDASDRYGLGYALSNGCIGVHFRDSSSTVLAPYGASFDYVQPVRQASSRPNSIASLDAAAEQQQNVMQRSHYAVPQEIVDAAAGAGGGELSGAARKSAAASMPSQVVSKLEILLYFNAEITERLCGVDHPFMRKEASLTRNMVFVYKWFRSHNAIIFQLSNDTLQYNFYDHIKVFLLDQGLTIAAIAPSELTPGKQNLYTWSLTEMVSIALKDRSAREAAAFEEAERLGLDVPAIDMTTAEERKVVRKLMKKLRFCRDVLTAASRSNGANSASTGATRTTSIESAREALQRTASSNAISSR